MLKLLYNAKNKYLNINKQIIELKIKMKDFFPENLGQKHGCALYTAKCSVYI